jgi:hypothetical protein
LKLENKFYKNNGADQYGQDKFGKVTLSPKEACHLKDRNNSGGLCWLIENLVDFSWQPTSKIVFQMASLFHRIAVGSIECPSQLRLPVLYRSAAAVVQLTCF